MSAVPTRTGAMAAGRVRGRDPATQTLSELIRQSSQTFGLTAAYLASQVR